MRICTGTVQILLGTGKYFQADDVDALSKPLNITLRVCSQISATVFFEGRVRNRILHSS